MAAALALPQLQTAEARKKEQRAAPKTEDEDVRAAALLAWLCGCDAKEGKALAKVAAEEGGDDSDPWPALLRHVPMGSSGEDALPRALRKACLVASNALIQRREQLEAVTLPKAPPRKSAAGLAEAWRIARRLRSIEEAILNEAGAGEGVLLGGGPLSSMLKRVA